MALRIDTHEAIQQLQDKGYDANQAEGMVEFVLEATDDLATKSDIAEFQAATKADIAAAQAEMKADLRAANAELRAELYRAFWIFSGIILGGVVGIATVAVTLAAFVFD